MTCLGVKLANNYTSNYPILSKKSTKITSKKLKMIFFSYKPDFSSSSDHSKSKKTTTESTTPLHQDPERTSSHQRTDKTCKRGKTVRTDGITTGTFGNPKDRHPLTWCSERRASLMAVAPSESKQCRAAIRSAALCQSEPPVSRVSTGFRF